MTTCPVCDVPLKSKRSIAGHMRAHNSIKYREDRECAECGKTFTFQLSQAKHYPNAGWCCSKSCAQRWARTKKQVVLADGSPAKECARCRGIKPLEAFYRIKTSWDGRYSRCKECVNEQRSTDVYKARTAKRSKEWAKSPEGQRAIRNTHLKRLYGITIEDYEEMAASTDGECWACGRVPAGTGAHGRLFVDHVHETGQVRGLLCHNCNSALGHARDDILILKALMDYLVDAEDDLEEGA